MTARPRAALAALGVAVATAALYFVSKGKWSDAIVDSGIEWAYADALARGRVLYRDVVYWFGPFTPHFQAAFFRVFGSSFRSLAIAGAAASLGILAALWACLRRVASPRDALLGAALAIPALLFMPNSGGAIIGMGYRIWHPAAFTLLAIALASAPAGRSPAGRAALAGACAGLAGLCRAEWGIMAVAGVVTAVLLARRPRPGRAATAAVAALLVFAAGLGVAVLRAGWRAVLGDGHVLLLGVSPETRRFLVSYSGIRRWPRGLAELVYSAALWAGVALAVRWVVLPKSGARRGVSLGVAAAVLALLGLSAAAGGAGGGVAFGAAPVACLAAIVAGFLRRGRPSGAALAACGLVGLLAFHRRPFHIVDGAYVGPPLLFALVGGVGLLHLASASAGRGADRRRLAVANSAGLAVLIAAAFGWRMTQYLGDERVPVAGTRGMLSASPTRAGEIADAVRAIRERARPADELVVLPEGQLFNALTGLPDPLRHELLIPGYLTGDNEPEVLAELERQLPRMILVWPRPTDEYGPARFGDDYGRRILEWIERNYDGPIAPSRRGAARLYVRRGAPGSGA